VRGADGAVAAALDIRRPVTLEMDYVVRRGGLRLVPNLHVLTGEGTYAFVTSDVTNAGQQQAKEPGRYRSRVTIPGNFLAEGTYVIGAALSTMDPTAVHFWERDAVAFQVIDSFTPDTARGAYGGAIPGVVRPLLPWETDRLGDG
jgi:lipopolysaccharide transport system ATP-binding protein